MKYNKKTQTAIKIAIKKWQCLAENGYLYGSDEFYKYSESYSKYIAGCPLCDLFLDKDCAGCPIAEKPKNTCKITDSPYRKWVTSTSKRDAKSRAKKMVKLLEGLK